VRTVLESSGPLTFLCRDSLPFYKQPDYLISYLGEAFVLLLHTPPYMTGIVSDKFGIVMFARAYLFLRVVRVMNPVWSRATDYKNADQNGVPESVVVG
jgi:hypothetical protein